MGVDDLGLYQELLLDHYKNPRYRGLLNNPSLTSEEYNPSCGDTVEISCIVTDSGIQEIGFVGAGCIISQAVASIVAEKSMSATLDEILSWNKESVLSWINNMTLGPTRMKCALMALEALQSGLRRYLKK